MSWRVAILPFLEQEQLYKQFHLDEPWDSEHNKKLIPLMPKVYLAPGAPQSALPGVNDPNESGVTYYQIFVGGGAAWDRSPNTPGIPRSFPDGTYGGQPAGWIIETGGKTIYHAGDTALFGDMALIGKMWNIDLACLPIGEVWPERQRARPLTETSPLSCPYGVVQLSPTATMLRRVLRTRCWCRNRRGRRGARRADPECRRDNRPNNTLDRNALGIPP